MEAPTKSRRKRKSKNKNNRLHKDPSVFIAERLQSITNSIAGAAAQRKKYEDINMNDLKRAVAADIQKEFPEIHFMTKMAGAFDIYLTDDGVDLVAKFHIPKALKIDSNIFLRPVDDRDCELDKDFRLISAHDPSSQDKYSFQRVIASRNNEQPFDKFDIIVSVAEDEMVVYRDKPLDNYYLHRILTWTDSRGDYYMCFLDCSIARQKLSSKFRAKRYKNHVFWSPRTQCASDNLCALMSCMTRCLDFELIEGCGLLKHKFYYVFIAGFHHVPVSYDGVDNDARD